MPQHICGHFNPETGNVCKRPVRVEGGKCHLHSGADPDDAEVSFMHTEAITKSLSEPEKVAVEQIKTEMARLRKQLRNIEDPESEKKMEFYKLNRKDPDIITEVRNRLISVQLYQSDSKIPWQLIKMVTDWKYDQTVVAVEK